MKIKLNKENKKFIAEFSFEEFNTINCLLDKLKEDNLNKNKDIWKQEIKFINNLKKKFEQSWD